MEERWRRGSEGKEQRRGEGKSEGRVGQGRKLMFT